MLSLRAQAKVDLAAETLARAGHLKLRVTGSSMLPTITPGSSVSIRRIAPEEVSVGDIVLVRCVSGFRLHRLVALVPGGIMTRGDNLDDNDCVEPVLQLLGRVERIAKPGLLTRLRRRLAA